MNRFLAAWQEDYNKHKYSREVYFRCIKCASEADTPDELGEALIEMIHWKNGRTYPSQRTTQNSYRPDKHGVILKSQRFFTWAKGINTSTEFDVSSIKSITHDFKLWNTIVMPVLVLHVLNPLVYPLYDRYVQLAKQVLLAEGITKVIPTAETYVEYRDFFLSLATPTTVQEVKFMDEALWSFGRWLTRLSRGKEALSIDDSREPETYEMKAIEPSVPMVSGFRGTANADKLFSYLCITLKQNGFSRDTKFTIQEIANLIPEGTAGINNSRTYGYSMLSMFSEQRGRDYFIFDEPNVRDEFTALCRIQDRDNYYWRKHHSQAIVRINSRYLQ